MESREIAVGMESGESCWFYMLDFLSSSHAKLKIIGERF